MWETQPGKKKASFLLAGLRLHCPDAAHRDTPASRCFSSDPLWLMKNIRVNLFVLRSRSRVQKFSTAR
jgi:hypothetical protein